MTLLRDYLGKAIRDERLKQERSLRDVAAASFMSLGYLSEVERGIKEVSSEVLDLICAALFMSLPDLLVEVVIASSPVTADVVLVES
jgi:transcriptional regulator with XRE-family HTH domain